MNLASQHPDTSAKLKSGVVELVSRLTVASGCIAEKRRVVSTKVGHIVVSSTAQVRRVVASCGSLGDCCESDLGERR